VLEQGEMLMGEIKRVGSVKKKSGVELIARTRALKQALNAYAVERGDLNAEFLEAVRGDADPDTLCDRSRPTSRWTPATKQLLLEPRDVPSRVSALTSNLAPRWSSSRWRSAFQARVRDGCDQHQKE
jgi:ATP-dependent Lon protease